MNRPPVIGWHGTANRSNGNGAYHFASVQRVQRNVPLRPGRTETYMLQRVYVTIDDAAPLSANVAP